MEDLQRVHIDDEPLEIDLNLSTPKKRGRSEIKQTVSIPY